MLEELEQTASAEETAYVRAACQEVQVGQEVLGYLMDIVEATRQDGRLSRGVSTRGAIALYKAAQALALLAGREYAIPEDVKYAAPYVLAHRIAPAGGNRAGTAERLVRELLDAVPVPLERV